MPLLCSIWNFYRYFYNDLGTLNSNEMSSLTTNKLKKSENVITICHIHLRFELLTMLDILGLGPVSSVLYFLTFI